MSDGGPHNNNEGEGSNLYALLPRVHRCLKCHELLASWEPGPSCATCDRLGRREFYESLAEGRD